jgi:phosphoribosylamine--glycine ligase
VLYAGVMVTREGPQLLEYNCRFGDPETQVLLPRMPYQLGTLLHACATGTLAEVAGHAGFDEGAAVTVVLASEGYPGSYATGRSINGVQDAADIEGVTVFHAGTVRNTDGEMVTAGGRVFDVTARGATLAEARERAYRGVAEISFEGMQFRTDIAARAAEEER